MKDTPYRVGDRVEFTGPAYRPEVGGPRIGQVGNVTEVAGHYAQATGGEREELLTAHFDGDERPTVVAVRRIRLEEAVR